MLSLGVSAMAADHPGKEAIEKNGYKGPATCEECHPGTAKGFLDSVHWKHASKVTNVEGIDPKKEYGMKNRVYTMCNGNDIVNNLKEIPKSPETGKTKFTGCNTCHPGDHLSDVGSTGAAAEEAIDCLVCHSTDYDFRQRKAFKNEKGEVVMGQDRSTKAAVAIGKPTVKNCMVCHEAAGAASWSKEASRLPQKQMSMRQKGWFAWIATRQKTTKYRLVLIPTTGPMTESAYPVPTQPAMARFHTKM